MRAGRLLVFTLTVALVAAEGDSLLTRSKRQAILFPGEIPSPPVSAPQPPATSPDAALDLPEDLDLNNMDRESLSRINSVDKVAAFADLFGIPLPDAGLEVDIRLGGSAAEVATPAACKPEVRTVELDLPVEANTLFYPTCVRMEQCGGCCYGPLLTCRPKLTTEVKLKVLKTVVSNGSTSRRRLKRSRRRRQTVPSYQEVTVLRHDECECGCKVREEDCNPAIHTYFESECACLCKSKDEKARCEQQSPTKYWDNDTCNCYCRRPVNCSSGEFFSQTSCKCERL